METTIDRPAAAVEKLWTASDALTPRVKALRDRYWSFYTRAYTNEVRAFTTGTAWDQVYSIWHWTNVPEMTFFFKGARSYLLASATKVPLPAGFFDEPLPVRVATFFAEVVQKHLPAQILEDELVVGSHFCTALSRCLTKAEAAARDGEEEFFLAEWTRINDVGIGNCAAVPGHLIPDYPKALKIGWRGIRDRARAVADDPAAPRERREFARSMVIAAEAVKEFSARYAAEASRLAAGEKNPGRRAELLHIAEVCAKVPWEPAGTFHEAVQALWTTHMLVLAAESYPGPGVSPGRIDQYLRPYYEADLAAGRITRTRAKELLSCLFIKHNYAYDYQGWAGTNQGINASFGQLITLGGIHADGSDASSDLTFLILEIVEELNLLEPKPNIRLHKKTPEPLMTRVVEMLAKAQGAPFLLNFDENAIAGLRWQGLPEDALWDYAPVGCLENTLQGCDRSGTVDVNLNLAKAVELALNDGRDMRTGDQVGPRTGDPLTFATFDAFYDAFARQLRFVLDEIIRVNDIADAGRAAWEPVPYLSALVGGCLESGRDVSAGGARHNYLTVEGVALATAADSVTAVKKLVYEDRAVGMKTLLAALNANFEGHEPLRRMLLAKAPKYGNDDPYADGIARAVSLLWTEEAARRVSPSGKRYRAGYLSWNYWIAYAPATAATPDGRRRGQYLSNAVCPANGADRHGPTSVIKSVGALDLKTAPNGASHTMSFSPELLRSDEGRQKLGALLRAYGQAGGTALQVNVINADTLREAQRSPAEYQNLLVRVTGYNAYFAGLGREIQDEIIAREAHEIA